MNIISERALNPYNTIVRVSIDGGGGSLKICVNIFDADELKVNSNNLKNRSKRQGSDEYIGSGLQHIQFIAIAEDKTNFRYYPARQPGFSYCMGFKVG